ncbi:MAG: radical SAM protein [Candidatus Lokiarchaeota archaeon]|nr:radical SAM protein [Candidatus Lokiarchaeota archaeon]
MTEILLRHTLSICPECQKNIKARIVEDGNLVLMRKTCEEHGDFEDILSKDPELYKWKHSLVNEVLHSRMDTAPQNIELQPFVNECPNNCGLCSQHKSAANLMILDVTNRCNLNCPICYANANAAGHIVEYSYEETVRIMEHFVKQRPYFAPVAQFSGGEPTLHPDIVKIIKKAAELSFQHILLNTNGVKMAQSIEFCKELKNAYPDLALYLSFDGIEPETYKSIRGVDLSKVKRKVIENCREVGITGVQLVMTVCKGENDHEVENVLQFARENNDVVCGIVFQPVSLCGRVTMEDLRRLRYTNSDLTQEIERITKGSLSPKDFYPLGASNKLTQLLSWFSDNPGWAITAHDSCGFATVVQIQPEGGWKPLHEYLDVEGMLTWAGEVWDMVQKCEIPKPTQSGLFSSIEEFAGKFGMKKLIDALGDLTDNLTDIAYRNMMKAYFIAGTLKYIYDLEWRKILDDKFYINVFKLLVYPSLRTSKDMLLNGLLFIGSMHFQDIYNFDIERVQRCVVHYGVLDPDDESHVLEIPFCAFNTLHRERIETKWAKNHKKKLDKTPKQQEVEVQKLIKELS